MKSITFEFEIHKDVDFPYLYKDAYHYRYTVDCFKVIIDKLKQYNYNCDVLYFIPIAEIYLKFALIRFFNERCCNVLFIKKNTTATNVEHVYAIDTKEAIEFDYNKACEIISKHSQYELSYLIRCDIDFNAPPLSIRQLEQMRII